MKVNKFIGMFFLVIVIISGLKAQVKPTNEWVSFYGNSSLYLEAPIPVGTQINGYDPQGVLCGSFTVTKAGEYGFLAVYRDDALTTTIDEGAVPGDTIRFTINGAPAKCMNPGVNVWTNNGAVIKAELTTNRAPAATRPMKDISLNEDAPLYIVADLDTVFFDPDKDALTYSVQETVPGIQVSKDSENRLKLTLTANWNGTGQIIVMASDGTLTARDTVSVTIIPVNDAPMVVRPMKDISLNEDAPLYIVADLDTVFADLDNDSLVFDVPFIVPGFQVQLDEENRLTILVDSEWTGQGLIIAIASDGTFACKDTLIVMVNPVNDAPKIIHSIDEIVLDEDAPLYIAADLDTLFADPDGDSLKYSTRSSELSLGSELDNENRLLVRPRHDWNGQGWLYLSASDNMYTVLDSVLATVRPVNDAPVRLHPVLDVVLDEDTPVWVIADLDTVFADVDQDILIDSVKSSAEEIQARINSENHLSVLAKSNWTGDGLLVVSAFDGYFTAYDSIKVMIRAVNDTPIVRHALSDFSIDEDTASFVVADLDTLFFDADLDTLAYSVASDSSKLKTILTPDNQLLILPQPNANGLITMILRADDGRAAAQDTVQVMINPVNDSPIIASMPDTFFVNTTMLKINLNLYASDVEERPEQLLWSLKLMPDKQDSVTFIIDQSNMVTFEAGYNFAGQITVIFTVSDSCKSTAADTINIRIDYPVGVDKPQIAALPRDYCLSPNYPNPFNPETSIRFGLPKDGDVELTVYNLMGQQVRVIAGGAYKAGWHILYWNGQDDYGRQTGSGIYLIRLVANGVSRLQKMTLVR